ncbi:uncharacterized protein LOC141911268 isoform X3 [Tubulanus polymorphus]|uniref:uncharacterized protein LOC141911268 isoform X3 n=1 Tax=Tubulanus polymorphus TaxID=672921 RepID=UPI003DA5E730
MGVLKSKFHNTSTTFPALPFEKSKTDIFIPHKKYRPFPVELRSEPRTICSTFSAMPRTTGRRPVNWFMEYGIQEPLENFLWLVDCEFIPCSDVELVGCGGISTIRSISPRLMTPEGFVVKWHLASTTAYRIYPGTSSAEYFPQPRIRPHPNGKYVCFVDGCKIYVQDIETGAFNERERLKFDTSYYISAHCCGAVSPNGAYLAFIARFGDEFELSVIETRAFRVVGRVRYSDIGRDEYVGGECKWSPDSQFIAIAMSNGDISLVDCRDKKRPEPFLNVVDDFEKFGSRISNPRAFDFDPKSAHSVLAFATRGNASKLHVYDVDEKAVVRSTVLTTNEHEADDEDDFFLFYGRNCPLRYSRSGDVIAVTLGLRIQILNANDLRVIYILDGIAQDNGGYVRQLATGKYPFTIHVSFSRFDEYLAVSSTDGFIRVWQLDADLNLQDLCRKVILASTYCDRVKFLPIPDRLKFYLLQIPDWAASCDAEAYV